MMLKIGIIDDEINAQQRLEKIIDKVLFRSDIDYKLFKYNNASSFFSDHNYDLDLLFLDIEMGEENGLNVSKALYEKGIKSIIVFVTSYDGYIKDAFGLNVYGFVTKDEVEERIPIVLDKILTDLKNKSYIVLNSETGALTLKFHDILYFTIQDRKCYVKTKNETKRFFATSLKEIKQNLGKQFLSPNAKYIVNAQHIESIENGVIIMDNEECIFISRGKYKKFEDMYKDYLLNEV